MKWPLPPSCYMLGGHHNIATQLGAAVFCSIGQDCVLEPTLHGKRIQKLRRAPKSEWAIHTSDGERRGSHWAPIRHFFRSNPSSRSTTKWEQDDTGYRSVYWRLPPGLLNLTKRRCTDCRRNTPARIRTGDGVFSAREAAKRGHEMLQGFVNKDIWPRKRFCSK